LSKFDHILYGREGERYLLLGNEAIARGCIEGGVDVVTAYPGTPSSEIADTLSQLASKGGFYMEYSTNEKVAVEVAGGAAIAGARAVTTMKHVGVNVAADTLATLAYVGIRGAFVVVSADDPNAWSSQNEQDNRLYAPLFSIPCIEPSDPQEAKDFTLYAFELSEKLELPVMLRTTTRISHTRGPVVFGPIKERRAKGFVRDRARFVMIPAHARTRHKVLLQKLEEAQQIAENAPINKVHITDSKVCIVTSGVSYGYVADAIKQLGEDIAILKLGFIYPPPVQLIWDFIKRFEEVIVIEELEPYLERIVKQVIAEHQDRIVVHGKNLLPRCGELSIPTLLKNIAHKLGKKVEESKQLLPIKVPKRPPVLCPGCPHRASALVLKRVIGDAVATTDIGCYALQVLPPLELGDVLVCMGASIGIACGIAVATGQRVAAVIGDSTYFHAGLPGTVNAVYNKHNIMIVILDNGTTAMTGHQPHPGTGIRGLGDRGVRVLLEDVVRGCGVRNVKVVDPYNLKEAEKAVRSLWERDEVTCVIFRRRCVLLEREKPRTIYRIDQEKCTKCMSCIRLLGCPAIQLVDGSVVIRRELCAGCGVCAQVCPSKAIVKT